MFRLNSKQKLSIMEKLIFSSHIKFNSNFLINLKLIIFLRQIIAPVTTNFHDIFRNTIFFRQSNLIEFDRTELIEIIQMHQIHHVKAFKCNKTEFDSIEPNPYNNRNIEKDRIHA